MNRSITLNNNLQIPCIGYGTGITSPWISENGIVKYYDGMKSVIRNSIDKNQNQISIDRNLVQIVRRATDYGLELIDTARGYGSSEYIVGKAIKKHREDYFISTKLSNTDQREKKVRDALNTSLKMLQTEYVDLYLMHWPQTNTFIENWIQMEELYKEGVCKAIGVCNFNIHHLKKLREYASVMPLINQIEYHPLFQQRELEQYCNDNNIVVMAYTPTGRMDKRISENSILIRLAKKYQASVPQIILAWHMQQKRIPIVHTSSLSHVVDNLKSCNIKLQRQEISEISMINCGCRLRFDPDNCDFLKL